LPQDFAFWRRVRRNPPPERHARCGYSARARSISSGLEVIPLTVSDGKTPPISSRGCRDSGGSSQGLMFRTEMGGRGMIFFRATAMRDWLLDEEYAAVISSSSSALSPDQQYRSGNTVPYSLESVGFR
jgi:hypothetical protein